MTYPRRGRGAAATRLRGRPPREDAASICSHPNSPSARSRRRPPRWWVARPRPPSADEPRRASHRVRGRSARRRPVRGTRHPRRRRDPSAKYPRGIRGGAATRPRTTRPGALNARRTERGRKSARPPRVELVEARELVVLLRDAADEAVVEQGLERGRGVRGVSTQTAAARRRAERRHGLFGREDVVVPAPAVGPGGHLDAPHELRRNRPRLAVRQRQERARW